MLVENELLTRDFGSVLIQPTLPLRPTRSVFDNVAAIDRVASMSISMRAATNTTNTAEDGATNAATTAEPLNPFPFKN